MVSLETLWGLGRAVLLALLLFVLLVRLFEERFVFFPNLGSGNDWNPQDQGVEVEDVYFTTSDAVRLHAWWSRTPEATHTILYFHGNAGNISDRLPNIAFLQQLPANVFAVDYRGYGKSQGRPSEEGVYRDAEAAYDYLAQERRIAPERLVVLGQSLGTAVAVDLARQRKVAGLILEAGFPSARRVAQKAIWIPGLRYLIRSRFDSAAKLREIRVPVLVAHCRADSTIPYELGEELFAAANEPKTFVSYPGNCHEPLFMANPEDYAAKLQGFLQSIGEAKEG